MSKDKRPSQNLLIGIETNIENLQRKPSVQKQGSRQAPKVKVDPSYNSILKSDLSQPLSTHQPPTVRGTSSRAGTALKKKPADDEGSIVKLSDRHSLCISPRGSEVAVGSSDKSIYIVNVDAGKFVRTLASKQWGHTDCVTCVEFMDDGRILSGGMDNKLCLWEKNAVKCSNLIDHNAAISACTTIAEGTLGISSSHDTTLKVWDLGNSQKGKIPCLGTFKGHKGPVTHLCLSAQETNIVSGSKNGEVILWDGAEGRSLVRCVDAHNGRVTALQSMVGGNSPERDAAGTGEMFLTGGQDGILQVWDFRVQPGPVFTAKVHRTFDGCPVAFVGVSHNTAGTALVVTAGGDKTFKILDPRASFQTLHTMKDHVDNITCLLVHGGLAWSGSSEGKVLLHEASTGECLYGLQAVAKGGVRCMCLAGDNKLAVAGDDGNVRMFPH